MESLYKPGKSRIQEWTRGHAGRGCADKANELILPEGRQAIDESEVEEQETSE